jgi:hypothetical protein
LRSGFFVTHAASIQLAVAAGDFRHFASLCSFSSRRGLISLTNFSSFSESCSSAACAHSSSQTFASWALHHFSAPWGEQLLTIMQISALVSKGYLCGTNVKESSFNPWLRSGACFLLRVKSGFDDGEF